MKGVFTRLVSLYAYLLTAIGRYAFPILSFLFLRRTIKYTYPMRSFLSLTALQSLFGLSYALGQPGKVAFSVICGFGGLILAGCVLGLWGILQKRTLLALYLSSLGMCVICAVCPEEAPKQIFALFLGVAGYLFLRWALRSAKWREWAGKTLIAGSMLLLFVTLLYGREENGAKSWLYFQGVSLQSAELGKLALVYAGGLAQGKGGRFRLLGYGLFSIACLALSKDFGTALLYFATLTMALFCYSRLWGTSALLSGAILGSGAIRIVPRIKGRFAAWGNIWQAPLDSGYQQTRALSALAAGGLLGLGAGQGQLPKLFSAASDLATATLGEQWGIFSVIGAVAALAALLWERRENPYFCGAAVALLSQAALNFFGMVDFLPFTGVPFPFLSNGGSAMVCAWGMLAFLEVEDD